jgi:hypothetical protein
VANPVIVADLEARFRSLTEDEHDVAQALLDDAWAILLVNKPNLETQIADGDVSREIVTFVVSAMALRVLRNPEGIRQWSIDDASFTRDNALSAGGLYLSPDELRLLSPAASGTGAAFTISPTNDGPGYRTDSARLLGLDWS